MTYYTVYQTTNEITNQIYVGTHRTQNPNDSYMGSGTRLLNSISKYGVENFSKTVLHIYESSEEMFSKEGDIVNQEFLDREDTLNIRLGGFGGFDHINTPERVFSDETRMKLSKASKGKVIPQEMRERISKTLTGRTLPKHQIENLKRYYEVNGHPWDGRKHKESSKAKMSESHMGKILSDETRKKMSRSRLGNKSAIRKTTSINGVIYETAKEASKKLGIKYPTLKARIYSKNYPEYFYI